MTTAQRLALAGLTLDGADLRDESGAIVGRVSGESAALRGLAGDGALARIPETGRTRGALMDGEWPKDEGAG